MVKGIQDHSNSEPFEIGTKVYPLNTEYVLSFSLDKFIYIYSQFSRSRQLGGRVPSPRW